jgi:hypothetical protein
MLCTPTLGDNCSETELVVRPVRPTDHRPTSAMHMLRTILGALREGLAAHRRYEHLRSKGVHHNLAIRQALGISHPASASEERRRCCRAGSCA